MAKRAAKGSVSVEVVKNRIRLRFRYKGRQHVFFPRLSVCDANFRTARILAQQIQLDIVADRFDESLDRYRHSGTSIDTTTTEPYSTVSDVFQRFISWKAEAVDTKTLAKYAATLKHLNQLGVGKLPVKSIGSTEAKRALKGLEPLYSPLVLKERIGLLKACWDWAKKYYGVTDNPWSGVRVKVPPKQPPKPFSRHEIQAILGAFQQLYSHYYPYVLFLFSTGVRTSEAIGLRWKHIGSDCIWIGESLTKGIRKSTKTNRARTIPIPIACAPYLIGSDATLQFKPPYAGDDDLVFATIAGCPISDNNFCNRYWKPALKVAGVPYRRPYVTRHSFISGCLQSGLSPIEVASLTGHRPQVLYEHYAGLVTSPKIPELF
jgi:integrase